jgi:phosphatidylglycerophosphate synthase
MSKYKDGEALPLEVGLYNTVAPVFGPFLHDKLGMDPNDLTVIGFVLGLIVMFLMLDGKYTAAALLLAFRQVLDAMDGYIARRYNKVTPIGPCADSKSDVIIAVIIHILILLLLSKKYKKYYIIFILIELACTQIYKYRTECIKRKNECVDEKVRNKILTSSRHYSYMEFKLLTCAWIFSLNYLNK